jgi:hypothetical protein
MGGGPYAKNSGPSEIRREGVIAKLGVTPEEVVDLKALTGDSSDNIPGVKGVGPKTAISLLKEFEHVDGIYAALEALEQALSLDGSQALAASALGSASDPGATPGARRAVLVTVQQVQGSAPREEGAWMAVFTDRLINTLGGGHLEFSAIAVARHRAWLRRSVASSSSMRSRRSWVLVMRGLLKLAVA